MCKICTMHTNNGHWVLSIQRTILCVVITTCIIHNIKFRWVQTVLYVDQNVSNCTECTITCTDYITLNCIFQWLLFVPGRILSSTSTACTVHNGMWNLEYLYCALSINVFCLYLKLFHLCQNVFTFLQANYQWELPVPQNCKRIDSVNSSWADGTLFYPSTYLHSSLD